MAKYVVRIGDQWMPRLQPMECVIDLAHSQEKSEFLDMYTLAAAKFVIGTCSGPHVIPHCFGIPVLHTNSVIFRTLWCTENIRIPILYKDNSGELIPFDSLIKRKNYTSANRNVLMQNGMIPVNNSEDDICNGVEEMFNRQSNSILKNEEYNILQQKWAKVSNGQ